MSYRIFKCSKCKNFNISASKSYFSCKYCRNRINTKNSRVYYSNDNPLVVSKVLIKIKEEDFKNKINENNNKNNNYINNNVDLLFSNKSDDINDFHDVNSLNNFNSYNKFDK